MADTEGASVKETKAVSEEEVGRKREAAESDGEAVTPGTPSAEDVKKEKRAKLEEAGPGGAATEPEEEGTEPTTEVESAKKKQKDSDVSVRMPYQQVNRKWTLPT